MAPNALASSLPVVLAQVNADNWDHSARNVIIMCVGILVLMGIIIWWLRR